jgi:hypothetical protein
MWPPKVARDLFRFNGIFPARRSNHHHRQHHRQIGPVLLSQIMAEIEPHPFSAAVASARASNNPKQRLVESKVGYRSINKYY